MTGGAYAVIRDVPASWSVYIEAARDLPDPAPKGLLAHAAGPTDEGFRVVDIWASRAEWERFCAGSQDGTFREFEVRDLYLASVPRFVSLDPRPDAPGELSTERTT
jgi:hypothetical protein